MIKLKVSTYYLLMLLVALLASCTRDASTGDVPVVTKPFVRLLTNQYIQSTILKRNVYYNVLLPKDYDSTKKSYPVVYLLHGYGDNNTAWINGGYIQYYVDLYAAQTVPMIYVMPDGYNTYYVNKYDGTFPYMDMFVQELVPAIDTLFRTIKDASGRAVMGYSMGGYGALILPAKNPNVFKTSVVLSMSFRTDAQYMVESQDGWNSQWASNFGGIGLKGTQRLTDYFKTNSPFYYYKNSVPNVNLFIDCGDDEESLIFTSDTLHDMLRNLNVPHEFRVRNGAHTWTYWDSALPEALKYIGYAVQKISYSSTVSQIDVGATIPSTRIISETLTGSSINFNVVLPDSYSSSTTQYPVIFVLHDNVGANQNNVSQNLYSLLSNAMTTGRLQTSIIVEIPFQTTTITIDIAQQILTQVKAKYRTVADKSHTVIIGNNAAGKLAFELTSQNLFSTCLLFDANLDDNSTTNLSGVSYWLDICESGTAYNGYHSLYTSVRQNQIAYEYRVRQGTPSHQTFMNGLNDAVGFINVNIKN